VTHYPRVAFFTDSYHETNGVAHTSRHLEAFAKREHIPFLCVRAGEATKQYQDESITAVEFKRSPIGFGLERDMRFDFLMWRNLKLALNAARDFQADLVHITGPSDIGQLGARIAFLLKVPLVISWHTNLHDYAGKRLEKLFAFLPEPQRKAIAGWGERNSLKATLRFYKLGRHLFAPNEELVDLLKRGTEKPTSLMQRGVNTEIFSPLKRHREDNIFSLGFVGRLSPEKNVRFLVEIEKALLDAGKSNFRFLLVGDGSERPWLEKHLRFADFTGILKGEALSKAYANMDAFLFPSQTDAFGNVILEAMASGVPCVVTTQGGPKFLVQHKRNGLIARDEREFITAVMDVMSESQSHENMRLAARQAACGASWNRVFEKVYDDYRVCLQSRNLIEAHSQFVAAR
jgi:phosphatidylinositol alpha 1,6-mannosyltransferase